MDETIESNEASLEIEDDIRIESLKYVEQRCMKFGMWGPPMMMVHAALKQAEDELEDGARETIDALTAENRALEAELRMARGELKTALNNIEAGRIAVERKRAELDERKRRLDVRDAMTVEQVTNAFIAELEEKCERLTAQRDELRAENMRLGGIIDDIRTLTSERMREHRRYELGEVDDG